MKKIVFFCLFLSLFSNFSFSQESVQDKKPQIPIVVDGDTVNYDSQNKAIEAEGNVKISFKDVTVFCDNAKVDTQTSIGKLEGNVRIKHEKGTIYGDNIIYDFKSKTAEINDMYLNSPPFYVYGKKAKKVSGNVYRLNDACATTCGPLNKPPKFLDYKLSAKEITLYKGDKLVAKHVVMRVGKLPVMYFPYYVQPAKDKLPRVTLVPGSGSDTGMYMLSAWRYYFDEGFKGRLHFDFYQNKGIGRGITHKYNSDSFGEGIMKLYYISDKDKESFDNQEGLDYGYPVGSDRYKVQIRHNWNITPTLNAKLEYHRFSDKYFMKDYFYREYERDTAPDSYLLLTQSLPYSSLSLLARKRVNDFYTQAEYLPRLKLDVFQRQIGSSKLYFEGNSSFANLSYKHAAPSDNDSDALRLDSYNRLTYVDKFAWLNFKPYLGMRETYYSKRASGESNVMRSIFYSGVELSTKVYKQMSGPLDFLGIKADKTRHVITPIIKYQYIHPPSISQDLLMQFDDIDAIDRKNMATFTLENKIQAKRGDKVWDLLYFAPEIDYTFNDQGRGSHLSELRNDLEFRPSDNFYLQQTYTYDLDNLRTKEVTSDIVLKGLLYKLTLGHKYVRNESSEIRAGLKYTLSPKWEFNTNLRYEAETGDPQEEEFYFRRDLNCWFMDIGLSVNEDNEKTFWLIFRIKAFPDAGIRFNSTISGPKE